MYTRLEGDLSEYMGVLNCPVPQMLVLLGVFLLYGIVLGILGSYDTSI